MWSQNCLDCGLERLVLRSATITCRNGLRPLGHSDNTFSNIWLRTVRIISLVDQGVMFKNRLNALGDLI
jgi:hypothetical protein